MCEGRVECLGVEMCKSGGVWEWRKSGAERCGVVRKSGSVWDLRHVGIAACGSCGTWELRHVGVAA